MTETSAKNDDQLPDAEAEERFNRTLGNLANTPPQLRGAEGHALDKREPSKPDSRPVSAPEKG